MLISLKQGVDGFIAYMSEQVATIPTEFKKWLGFGALAAVKRNPAIFISRIRPWLEMSGILTEERIDTDTLKAALEEAFSHVPNIEYFGFTFNSADVGPLLEKMQRPEVSA